MKKAPEVPARGEEEEKGKEKEKEEEHEEEKVKETLVEEDQAQGQRRRRRRVFMMLGLFVIVSLLSSCIVYSSSNIEDLYLNKVNALSNEAIGLIGEFNISDASDTETEILPRPAAQVGPEARNYVAYIPVPINDDEEDEEYYDEDDEYYEDDDEYYEDEEEEPPRKKPSRRKNTRKQTNRRKNSRRRGSNKRYYDDDEEDEEERVPFLVPLMMVPENQVGVQKEFSFSQGPKLPAKDGIFSNVLNQNNFGNNNNRRPFLPQQRPPNRINFNPGGRRKFNQPPQFNGPPARPVHDVPGPPYSGPPPRNPRLPMDDTIIHPSINRFRFRRPPRNFRPNRFNIPRQPLYTSTPQPATTTAVATTSTTTTETTTAKARPQVIIMQQQPSGGYRPYQPYGYNQYPQYPPAYYPPPQYQAPYPPPQPPSTTTKATTTTTIKTTTTTTRKPKRRKKKKSKLSPNRLNSLSQGQLTIVDNRLVPMASQAGMLGQPSSMFSSRLGLAGQPSGRRYQPKGIVRGRRRYPTGPPSGSRGRGMRRVPGRRQPNNFRRYQEYPRVPAREPGIRRFDMPNIYSQSGFDFETSNAGKPMINRPPPRHPGVKLPGIQVPPNAGNIQDIIKPKPVQNYQPTSFPGTNSINYSGNGGKYTIVNDFRPPIGSNPNRHQPSGSYVPPNQPQINYNQEPTSQYQDRPHENSYGQPPPAYNSPSPPPSYNSPPSNYNPPSQSYDSPPSNYNPPPSQSYDSPPQYSNPKPPPANSYDYQPPPYSPPTQPPYSPQNYNKPPAAYNPPASNYRPAPPPTASYRPPPSAYRPTSQPVQPPVYNQEFFMTDDPQDNYPGPEIYEGGNIHGPPANDVNSVQDYHQYGADKTGDYYEDRYPQTYTKPPATLGPPTVRPSRDPPTRYDQMGYRPYAPEQNHNSYQPPPRRPPHRDPYLDDVGVGPAPNDYSYGNDIDKVSLAYHPDGPDYSSGTTNLKPFGSKGSVPFKVGLDLYPMVTGTSLAALGKQDVYSLPPAPYPGEGNKHEVLLHLNLFSKKPSILGGADRREDINIGPFSLSGRKEKEELSFGRRDEAAGSKGHPLFGNLNPFDILQHLMEQSKTGNTIKKVPGSVRALAESVANYASDRIGGDSAGGHNQAMDFGDSRSKYRGYDSVRRGGVVPTGGPWDEVTTDYHEENNHQGEDENSMQNDLDATESTKITTRKDYDYEYDYAEEDEDTKETDESEEEGEKKEYYYYYYYEYEDEDGIDISHEMEENQLYEPLPTPLWQKGNATNSVDLGGQEKSSAIVKTDGNMDVIS